MKNEQNNEVPSSEAAAPKTGKGRLLKILLCLFIFAVILFAGTAVYLAGLTFSEPKQIPLQPLQPQDFKFQQRLIQRLYKEFFRKKPQQTARLKIRSAELPSLLRLVDFGLETAKLAGKYKGISLRELEPEITNGKIKIVFTVDTGYRWLFGGVLRFKFSGTSSFADKELQISLDGCRIGKIPVPEKIARQILDGLLSEMKTSGEFEKFCILVKEIQFSPQGDLVITYSPAKLALVLF